MHAWGVSSVLALLLVLAVVIATVLTLSVVTKRDEDVEADRANTIRAQLLLLLAIGVAGLVLVSQRYELGQAVKHMME